MNQVIVRYGPSPTGIPHIGNIRTALFNFLFAKNHGGRFLLRIEDTDQARIVPAAVEKIKESLNALGISWDELFIQSQRLEIYQKYLNELISKDLAYEEEGAWRFRIKTTKEKVSWEDVVHSNVEFSTSVIEDFVIVKSDGFPTYHFASVVDDYEMKITHVMRGDEWISSTPKHILLYEAFGWQHPKFAHLPPILGSNHKKLSKRDGAKSVLEYIKEGYLPQSIVNFLVLLGWSPKGNQEIFSLEELIKEFSLDRINKNSPIFNIEKLNWFNGQWIRKISDSELVTKIYAQNTKFNKAKIAQVLPIVKDRINFVSDFSNIANLFFEEPNLKNHAKEIAISKKVFEKLIDNLSSTAFWKEEAIKTTVVKIMDTQNLSKPQVYRSIGIALSGKLITPPIFKSMEILGQNKTIERLKNATEKLKS